MTLHDRHAFQFYMEGAKKFSTYQVMPLNVLEIADGLENIYTYGHYGDNGRKEYFAIGKVKGA
jgi:hypothetical protein